MNNLQKLGLVSIMLTSLFMVNDANANEVTPKKKPSDFVEKSQDWFQKEWQETVNFQEIKWAEGKQQLENNKLYIQNLWNKVKSYVSQN